MAADLLQRERTAVLFIDFQVDVCARGGRMVPQDNESSISALAVMGPLAEAMTVLDIAGALST